MDLTINRELHPDTKRWRAQRIRYWYDSIIDHLLSDPSLSQKEIAKRMGRSPVTISCIMNSDIFRARYEQRRLLMNTSLQEQINGKLTRLAIDAIEITHEKLKLQRDKIPFEDLVDVTDKTLTRLGYGTAKGGSVPQVVVNNNTQVVAPISAEQLEAARAHFLELQRTKVLEGDSGQSSPPLAAEVEPGSSPGAIDPGLGPDPELL